MRWVDEPWTCSLPSGLLCSRGPRPATGREVLPVIAKLTRLKMLINSTRNYFSLTIYRTAVLGFAGPPAPSATFSQFSEAPAPPVTENPLRLIGSPKFGQLVSHRLRLRLCATEIRWMQATAVSTGKDLLFWWRLWFDASGTRLVTLQGVGWTGVGVGGASREPL